MPARAVGSLALAVAVVAAGCGTGGPSSGGDLARGKTLFSSKCAGCHALADAGSVANVGPNLDDAFAAMRPPGEGTHFSDSTIRNVVLDQIRVAAPPMPADLLKGADAEAVAAYVASVAGKPAAVAAGGGGTSAGGGGGSAAADGKSIFSANCASCHTLAAAGATGTVGPNLDELKPDEARVKRQVENGGGAMPAFKGRLSDAQIAAVAKFVSSSAGKK